MTTEIMRHSRMPGDGSSAKGSYVFVSILSPKHHPRSLRPKGKGRIGVRCLTIWDTTIEGHCIRCNICCSTWPKLAELQIYERADICLGIPPTAVDLIMGHHECPKRVTASGLHVRGVKVHSSHTLAFLHGVLFCTRCGCYCVKIVRGLSQGCKMKPTNPV